MTSVRYEIVEHDGGWAYRVGAVREETARGDDRPSMSVGEA